MDLIGSFAKQNSYQTEFEDETKVLSNQQTFINTTIYQKCKSIFNGGEQEADNTVCQKMKTV